MSSIDFGNPFSDPESMDRKICDPKERERERQRETLIRISEIKIQNQIIF